MKITLQVSDLAPWVPGPEELTISIKLLTALHTACIPGVHYIYPEQITDYRFQSQYIRHWLVVVSYQTSLSSDIYSSYI